MKLVVCPSPDLSHPWASSSSSVKWEQELLQRAVLGIENGYKFPFHPALPPVGIEISSPLCSISLPSLQLLKSLKCLLLRTPKSWFLASRWEGPVREGWRSSTPWWPVTGGPGQFLTCRVASWRLIGKNMRPYSGKGEASRKSSVVLEKRSFEELNTLWLFHPLCLRLLGMCRLEQQQLY